MMMHIFAFFSGNQGFRQIVLAVKTEPPIRARVIVSKTREFVEIKAEQRFVQVNQTAHVVRISGGVTVSDRRAHIVTDDEHAATAELRD